MSLKIAVTGSTGMVGSALIPTFKADGHTITRIVRSSTRNRFSESTLLWDPDKAAIEKDKLEGHDVIIHLAGANIAAQRWTPAYKQTLIESRTKSTALLSQTILDLRIPPQVFLSASAIGFYGDRSAKETIDETSSRGKGFLADLCYDWEMASKPVENAGIRVVNMRIGVILGTGGGALAKMLPVLKLGVGGKLGSGQQMMSWIALAEFPALINHLILEKDLRGPVNLVSPQPVSNEEFVKTLGEVLRCPTVLPLPRMAIKVIFGEMGEVLLLQGANILPQSLLDSHYQFLYPDLKSTLEAALQSPIR